MATSGMPSGQTIVSESVLDVESIRQDFPILRQKVYGKPLVYLDNAATSQKPQAVIDALTLFYTQLNSNIHRGVHWLSQQATDAYELSRVKVQKFLNAPEHREIIFVRGTTEGINLVAQSLGRGLKAGDEILISAMEHHSNIVPWQMVRDQTGAVLRVAPINSDGEIILEELERLLCSRTRIVSMVHVSNALGTINPIAEITKKAHSVGARVIVDGAQAVPHMPVDVQQLDCDFYLFSGHKLFAPTGVGVLYGKAEALEEMPPYQGGGDMISAVTFEKTTYNELPHKFEAGTPNIAGVIGLGAALDYLEPLGMERIRDYENGLLAYAQDAVASVTGVRLVGTAPCKAGVVSFLMDVAHPHDVGTVLDQQGVAVRTGHHCAQPVMDFFGVPATTRASLAFYNTRTEINLLVDALHHVRKIFE